MRLDPPPERRAAGDLLPMINVVFLILVFFLVAGRLAPPEIFAPDLPRMTAPDTVAAGRADAPTIGLDRAGRAIAAGLEGAEAVQAAVAACLERCGADPFVIVADRDAPAVALAGLVAELQAAGIAKVALRIEPR
jgi:biopolymer transport protein ExbD